MYGIDGTRRLPEYELPWLAGYESSAPMRAGNAASGQFQLDVWGEVLDGLHHARVAGVGADGAAWDVQRAPLSFLEGNWKRSDNSLWKVRGERQHLTIPR